MTSGGTRGNDLSTAGSVKTGTMGFAAGFRCLPRGVRLVYVEHREILLYALFPMVLAALFVVGAWAAFWFYNDDILRWVWAEPGADAWLGMKHTLWRAAAVLLWAVLAVATVVSTVFLFSIFAAPFSDIISERVEGVLGTWTPRRFSLRLLVSDLWHTVSLELLRLAVKIGWLLPLFILSFVVPVVGHLVYALLGGYFLCKHTGMDYIDWCAARRGWTWRERLAFAKRHRFALLGLGAGVALSFMVPLLFVAVWPAAVAAGAILFADLREKEEAGNLSMLEKAQNARPRAKE